LGSTGAAHGGGGSTNLNAGRDAAPAPDDTVARPTHATYGDDFSVGGTMAAKWSLNGLTVGASTSGIKYPFLDTYIEIIGDVGAAIYQASPGAVDYEVVTSFHAPIPGGDIGFGPWIGSSNGAGYTFCLYQGQLYCFGTNAGFGYGGTVGNSGASMTGLNQYQVEHWIKIRKVGTNWTPYWSPDGTTWNAGGAFNLGTPTHIGFCKSVAAGQHRAKLFRFNVYVPTYS